MNKDFKIVIVELNPAAYFWQLLINDEIIANSQLISNKESVEVQAYLIAKRLDIPEPIVSEREHV